jgi:hypothetical protein
LQALANVDEAVLRYELAPISLDGEVENLRVQPESALRRLSVAL